MNTRGYSYLADNVKHQLNVLAEKCRNNIGAVDPPIIYDDLYENSKLNKKIIISSSLRNEGVINRIDEKKLKNIRGLLLVNEKQVYVIEDAQRYDKRINFVLGHEFAHWSIPSHKALLFQCTQFDLSAKARHQLEIEANYFSGEIGFLGNVFFQYLQSSELCFGHIKNLSDVFNLSIEATLRRSVEIEIRPCALLSLTTNNNNEENFLQTKYVVHSESFKKSVGEFNRFQSFPINHVLSQIVTNPIQDMLNDHKCEIFLGEKKIPLIAELWKNQWNIFVFVQPKDKSIVSQI